MHYLLARSAFSFLKFIDIAPRELEDFHSLSTLARQIRLLEVECRSVKFEPFKEYVALSFHFEESLAHYHTGTRYLPRMSPPIPSPSLPWIIFETFVVAGIFPTFAKSRLRDG